MTTLVTELNENSYNIIIGRALLDRADEFFNLDRRVLVITDSGVPKEYAERVAKRAREAKILTLDAGEGSKSFATLERVLLEMSKMKMDRGDAIVAVGGGVVGDLSGFAAACYMRGIDFYNIPTTLLSQVDSSIGGKTAINLGGIKNIVGAFHQPRGVLIDVDTLDTLSDRHFASGLAEAIKMSLTSDEKLFCMLEKMSISEIRKNIEEIILRSLRIKKAVVEKDEKESGLRKILNFGHTVGHGIEAASEMSLYHGECVALGMLPMCSDGVRERLVPVLKKVGLPTEYNGDIDTALALVAHDKKCHGGKLSAIYVENVGNFEIKEVGIEELCEPAKRIFSK